MESKKEVWQRGPIKNIPGLLQPVAHALLEAVEEVHEIMKGFPERLLWERPAGVASPAFHLQHLSGVLSRLFTYARNESLTESQLQSLSIEGNQKENKLTMPEMIEQFDRQVQLAMVELSEVKENALTEARFVGRKQIPTTLIGLYFHSAEHSMRHVGQLLVTVRVLTAMLK